MIQDVIMYTNIYYDPSIYHGERNLLKQKDPHTYGTNHIGL